MNSRSSSSSSTAQVLVALCFAASMGLANGLELTAENFDEHTIDKNIFIKFFAPWCGHCKSMAKDWKKVMDATEGHKIILVAEVDCTKEINKGLCDEFDVKGFPHLVFGSRYGPTEVYLGMRDYETLKDTADWLGEERFCSIADMSNCLPIEKDGIEEMDSKSDSELIELASTFQAAMNYSEERFKRKQEKIRAEAGGLKAKSELVIDKVKDQYDYNFVEKELKRRRIQNDGGVGGGGGDLSSDGPSESYDYKDGDGLELTAKNWDEVTLKKSSIFVKFFAPWCGHCKAMKPDWDKLMKEYKDHSELVVAEIDCTKDINKELCENAKVMSYPTIKYGYKKKRKDGSFKRAIKEYNENRDYKTMAALAKKLAVGNVELFNDDERFNDDESDDDSDESSDDDDDGGEFELTAKNFDEKTKGKIIFIKFFAPWCGHCKAMKPDWDKLMKKYKDHSELVVAEVDCTRNENEEVCEAFKVKGYPTIKYGPAKDSIEAIKDYSEYRDYETMAAFAKKIAGGNFDDDDDSDDDDDDDDDEFELTAKNFDEKTKGKTFFIKFFAPWCGHCKSMAPAWKKLMKEYKDHDVALVAEVDCTKPLNVDLCKEYDVTGFPTIIFGNPFVFEVYQGPRDYAELKDTAEDFVTKPVCSIVSLSSCPPHFKEGIEEINALDDDKLLEIARDYKGALAYEVKKFEKAQKKLRDEYQEMNKNKMADIDKIKNEHHFKHVEQALKRKGIKFNFS